MTKPIMPSLGAILFDFDGVIADSEPLHLAAFQRTLADEVGEELTEAQYQDRYLAYDDEMMIRTFLIDRNVEVTPERFEELLRVKEDHYEALAQNPPLLPGAPGLIRTASARWPIAIASGALEREIRHVIDRAGLSDCFSALVSADIVTNGKPHPEPYLTALERINQGRSEPIAPASCLVLEDSAAGIQSGKSAGMRVLAVTNSLPRAMLGEADRVVDSLEEVVEVNSLAEWFANLPSM